MSPVDFTSGVEGKGRGLGGAEWSHDQMSLQTAALSYVTGKYLTWKHQLYCRMSIMYMTTVFVQLCVYVHQCQYLHFVLWKVPEQIGLLVGFMTP